MLPRSPPPSPRGAWIRRLPRFLVSSEKAKKKINKIIAYIATSTPLSHSIFIPLPLYAPHAYPSWNDFRVTANPHALLRNGPGLSVLSPKLKLCRPWNDFRITANLHATLQNRRNLASCSSNLWVSGPGTIFVSPPLPTLYSERNGI